MLKIQDLTFSYPNSDKPALCDVSLEVGRGELVLLCGESGSGKSTLLRLIKKEIAPKGILSGEILLDDKPTSELSPKDSAKQIGFVFQDPDTQIVCDNVLRELAFTLENVGMDEDTLRLRVGELATYFDLSDKTDRETYTLSGGKKQQLCLASSLACDPKLLLLDEPTSRLDPIAEEQFVAMLTKLRDELGLTMIVSAHRLEKFLPVADRIILLEGGRCKFCAPTEDAVISLYDSKLCGMLPVYTRLGMELPVSVVFRSVRDCVLFGTGSEDFVPIKNSVSMHKYSKSLTNSNKHEEILSSKGVSFRYKDTKNDVLHDLDLTLCKGEIYCILGGNGTGKTTALRVLSGLYPPSDGKVRYMGKSLSSYSEIDLYTSNISMLSQDARIMFSEETVRAELLAAHRKYNAFTTLSEKGKRRAKDTSKSTEQKASRKASSELSDMTEILCITRDLGLSDDLLDRHPYDLSGGECQRAALAKLLLTKPKLLLLDEPTQGLDAILKGELANTLRSLASQGISILMVSHDTEFAHLCADKCSLLFDGRLTPPTDPDTFFSQNRFFTTAYHRLLRSLK